MATTPDEIIKSQYYEILAKEKIVENWYRHAPRDKDGFLLIDGVPYDPDIASVAMSLDTDHLWETKEHLTKEELAKRTLEVIEGIYNFFIGDDINTLLDPNASVFEKSLAFISLVPLPVGKAFKVLSKARVVIKYIKRSQLDEVITNRKLYAWSQGPHKSSIKNLNKHFKDHVQNKNEFVGYELKTPQDYAQLAQQFYEHPPKETLLFKGKNDRFATDQIIMYHEKKNFMLLTAMEGDQRVIKTFYQPSNGYNNFIEKLTGQTIDNTAYRIRD